MGIPTGSILEYGLTLKYGSRGPSAVRPTLVMV